MCVCGVGWGGVGGSSSLNWHRQIRTKMAFLGSEINRNATPQLAVSLQQWTSLGKFNTKACYDFFRSKGANICWTKLVWRHSLLPKHLFTL